MPTSEELKKRSFELPPPSTSQQAGTARPIQRGVPVQSFGPQKWTEQPERGLVDPTGDSEYARRIRRKNMRQRDRDAKLQQESMSQSGQNQRAFMNQAGENTRQQTAFNQDALNRTQDRTWQRNDTQEQRNQFLQDRGTRRSQQLQDRGVDRRQSLQNKMLDIIGGGQKGGMTAFQRGKLLNDSQDQYASYSAQHAAAAKKGEAKGDSLSHPDWYAQAYGIDMGGGGQAAAGNSQQRSLLQSMLDSGGGQGVQQGGGGFNAAMNKRTELSPAQYQPQGSRQPVMQNQSQAWQTRNGAFTNRPRAAGGAGRGVTYNNPEGWPTSEEGFTAGEQAARVNLSNNATLANALQSGEGTVNVPGIGPQIGNIHSQYQAPALAPVAPVAPVAPPSVAPNYTEDYGPTPGVRQPGAGFKDAVMGGIGRFGRKVGSEFSPSGTSPLGRMLGNNR